MKEDLTLTQEDGIATVTFNRPNQRNAINYHGWLDLGRMVNRLDLNDDVRVVVFTGAGDEAFSAGADIKDFETYRNSSAAAIEYADVFDGTLDAIETLSKPTISMIKGFCVGGGCELSMATDIRIAAENGVFGVPVARLGILVGYREMRRMVNLVGPGHTSYILLSARLLNAEEALKVGLVNEVVPLDEIQEHAYRLAREMAKLAPLSHARHKRIIQTVLRNSCLEGLSAEEEQMPFANFDSEDFQEGRRAFIEHRLPEFNGR